MTICSSANQGIYGHVAGAREGGPHYIPRYQGI
jgi:hypothetical protein